MIISQLIRSLFVVPVLVFAASTARGHDETRMPGGELKIIDAKGEPVGACPLRHTEVSADIAGFVGRTTVKQFFYNPTDDKIEAVYVFPLPQDAAVTEMQVSKAGSAKWVNPGGIAHACTSIRSVRRSRCYRLVFVRRR